MLCSPTTPRALPTRPPPTPLGLGLPSHQIEQLDPTTTVARVCCVVSLRVCMYVCMCVCVRVCTEAVAVQCWKKQETVVCLLTTQQDDDKSERHPSYLTSYPSPFSNIITT